MLLDRHRAKIVLLTDLAERLGDAVVPRSEGGRVVLCHGVFDVVHPGHVRHLLYAKSKADVLVCSITADKFVGKGAYRPHTPQELRAANLAVFDIVDFVVVSEGERPLDVIEALRPDFYAKGFEYSPTSGRPRAIPEAAVVEAYGGEVLYTPGDLVRSSSALLEAGAPDLRWDKLALVMERAGLTFDGLRAAVRDLRHARAHVVGDTIVDALLHCEMIGANAKTPTISVRRGRRDEFVGGAAVVALHAHAAGARVMFSSVVGDDAAGMLVVDSLVAAGVDVNVLVDRARPTTVKEAVVVDNYRMLKIDTVDNRTISDLILRRLCEQVAETPENSAVIFSDFRHGIFNARTIPALMAATPAGCRLRAADSQVASRWGNIADFRGFDLVAPNEREARHALADQDSGVRPLAARLRAAVSARWLILKMGARGVLAFGPEDESYALDAYARDACDPVGAGDAFLAYAALSLLRGGCLATATILGSLAAGLECEYDGNMPVAPEAVLARIDDAERCCA